MSKIKILSENLANKIAAGEVVERPASVVKEFVENAIDAGAGHILVQVEGGGTRLLRVIDDGEGMDADDILLCLERHATSKLSSDADLAGIRTLGFRGEAIPSIASVSHLTITSRQAGAELGSKAEIRFGKLLKAHEMGCAPGTIMEVRDLFGNVPARKKFLKSAQTELAHIDEVVRNYALARHRIGFTYRNHDREVFSLPAAADSLESRVRRLLGVRLRGPLVEVGSGADPHSQAAGMEVIGYLLPPEDSPAATLRMFVNGRAVRDRMIAHAVSEGLQGFLMKGRRPGGALFVTLPAEALDVNVHPTKQEIRFHDSNLVHQQVVRAVRQGIETFQNNWKYSVFGAPSGHAAVNEPQAPLPKTAGEPAWRQERLPVVPPPAELPPPARASQETRVEAALTPERSMVIDQGTPRPALPARPELRPPPRGEETLAPPSPTPLPPPFPQAAPSSPETAAMVLPHSDPLPPTPAGGAPRVPPRPAFAAAVSGRAAEDAGPALELRVIGQLLGVYILCENSTGLVAIDQHAAQERLLFENLKKQYAAREIPSQALLFPEVVECDRQELQLLAEYGEEIARLGLELQEFGGESYVIKAVPAALAHLLPVEVLRGILAQYGEQTGKGAARIEQLLATMACKAAIKAGQLLNRREMEELLAQMQAADIFSHCPHGRPVVKQFSAAELKKWFART